MASHVQPERRSVSVRNAREEIDQLETTILDALGRFGYPEASKFAVRLAIEEALVNAFNHGHKGMPKETPVTVEYAVDPKQLHLRVADRGKGFDPAHVPDCTAEENLDRPSGRGLMLIRSFMSGVRHERGGATLVMTYDKPAGGA